MKKILSCIVIGFLTLQMLSLFIAPISGEKTDIIEDEQIYDFIQDEIVVKFNPGVANEKMETINSKHGTSVIYKSNFADFQRLKIPKDKTVSDMIEIYQNNPSVEYAEPNYIARTYMLPNDLYYSYQWHLHGLDEGGIDMEPAWDISTGSGAVVAIVDTGISRDGNDLKSTCFVSGYDFVNNDNDPTDDNGHGTHVAGTVAQSTNNNVGVCGVAFDACLMPVKVLDSGGSGSYSDVADGIYYAVDNGANIISMSLGGPFGSSTLEDAVAYAYNHGVTVIAASGNDGKNGILYPATYDAYVIAVGATRYDKELAPYSNYGSSLDLVAPGGDLKVDQNGDGYGDGVLQETFDQSGWAYFFFQGTSMATPHVSGTAALLYSQGITSPDDIRNTLQSSAVDLGATGWDMYYGHGLINAYDALTYNQINNPPTCTLTADPNSGEAPLTTTFSMSASDSDGTIASWELDVDNDGSAEYSGSGSPPATQEHTYDVGDYTAELTVWDDLGATGADTTLVTVTGPNTAPDAPSSPSPADGATDVSISPTLSVYVNDNEGDTLTVTFYDNLNTLIGTDSVTGSGTASTTWSSADEYSKTYYWYAVADDGEYQTSSATWSFTTEASPPPRYYATQDIQVQNGGISGSYADTLTTNNVYEGITEAKTGPMSKLEHKWTIPVDAGYGSYIFNLEAYHTSNSENDDFIFSYSTDDATYTDMITVTKTSDNDAYQTYTLPTSLSGTVYIKVVDTDQNRGSNSQDTIYVDHMFIEVSGTPPLNNAPYAPTSPDPADTATGVSTSPTLSVYVEDPDNDAMNVTFIDADTLAEIGIAYDVPSGSRASVDWPGLNAETTYRWYAIASDGQNTTNSDTWSFTTGAQTPSGGIYVWDITWREKTAGRNTFLYYTVTVRIDSNSNGLAEIEDELASGATVYSTLTNLAGGSWDHSGVTDSNGQIEFGEKIGPGDYTAEVTNLVLSGYNYNPDLDRSNPSYYTIT